MDFGKAFVFMFEDPNWVRKCGIGFLVGLAGLLLSPILIGVIAFVFLAGYCLDVTRNVIRRERYPLPEWDDWGGFFVKGLKITLAILIWSLPLLLAMAPITFGSIWMGNDTGDGAAFGGIFLLMCGLCLAVLWAIFVTVISPAIYVRLAQTGRFASAFEVGELWNFTGRNLGNIIIAVILALVAGLIASAVGGLGVLLCGVGMLVTIPAATIWQYLVTAHLFGQVGAVDRDAKLENLELAPPTSPGPPALPEPPAAA
jgi:hypothetical protein